MCVSLLACLGLGAWEGNVTGQILSWNGSAWVEASPVTRSVDVQVRTPARPPRTPFLARHVTVPQKICGFGLHQVHIRLETTSQQKKKKTIRRKSRNREIILADLIVVGSVAALPRGGVILRGAVCGAGAIRSFKIHFARSAHRGIMPEKAVAVLQVRTPSASRQTSPAPGPTRQPTAKIGSQRCTARPLPHRERKSSRPSTRTCPGTPLPYRPGTRPHL